MVYVRQVVEVVLVVDKDMINCVLYGIVNGGDVFECYEYYFLLGVCILVSVFVISIWCFII